MLTNCLAACAHLAITVSEIERDIGRKSSFHKVPSLGRHNSSCIRRTLVLGELITDFSVLPLFFADDTHDSQLLTSTTPSGVADVCRRLERCVTAVHDWCTQSWAWVHFAKSKPTQSTSWLTQSNSIHNDHVYSDPHDIQSNPLYPAVAKHCSTKMFSFSI